MARDPAAAAPEPPDDTRQLTFEGRTITARPGQSVGAALVSAGITAWRSTRKGGRPRVLFCGIGVCYDCLITVDGRPDQLPGAGHRRNAAGRRRGR